jgi:hypothetical protein
MWRVLRGAGQSALTRLLLLPQCRVAMHNLDGDISALSEDLAIDVHHQHSFVF